MAKKPRPVKREPRGKPQQDDVPQFAPELLAKLRKGRPTVEKIFTSDELGLERLSDRLLRVVEALREGLEDPPLTRDTLLALAALGWNVSLLDRTERRRLIRDFGASFSEIRETRLFFARALRCAIRSKERLFPHDRRMIAGYEVRETPDRCIVNVASYAPSAAIDPARGNPTCEGETKEGGQEGSQDASQ